MCEVILQGLAGSGTLTLHSPASVIVRLVRMDSPSGSQCLAGSHPANLMLIFCCCLSQLLSQDWLAKSGRVTSSLSSTTLLWFSMEWVGREDWSLLTSFKWERGRARLLHGRGCRKLAVWCFGLCFLLIQYRAHDLTWHHIHSKSYSQLLGSTLCMWVWVLLLSNCLENHHACTQIQGKQSCLSCFLLHIFCSVVLPYTSSR